MNCARLAVLPLLVVPGLAFAGTSAPLPRPQAWYLESCGGCHGLNGLSFRPEVPDLQDRVGIFLCTEKGRRYLVQLPNVAFSKLDDSALAQTMNFVVFDLGGASVPKNARPYTADEVGELRQDALKNTDLAHLRAEILAGTAACMTGAGKSFN